MRQRLYSIDLIKQMAECDANYIRLLKLMPGLQINGSPEPINYSPEPINYSPEPINYSPERNHYSPERNHYSPERNHYSPERNHYSREFSVGGSSDKSIKSVVSLKITERFKYTSTVEIRQRPILSKWVTEPIMSIRVYHDAKTAEVTSYQHHRNFLIKYPVPNTKMYHRDEKQQLNKFLAEWLKLCLEVGLSLDKFEFATSASSF